MDNWSLFVSISMIQITLITAVFHFSERYQFRSTNYVLLNLTFNDMSLKDSLRVTLLSWHDRNTCAQNRKSFKYGVCNFSAYLMSLNNYRHWYVISTGWTVDRRSYYIPYINTLTVHTNVNCWVSEKQDLLYPNLYLLN